MFSVFDDCKSLDFTYHIISRYFTDKGKQKKKKKKKLVPHADLSSGEEESVTIVNPMHAHLENNPQQATGRNLTEPYCRSVGKV